MGRLLALMGLMTMVASIALGQELQLKDKANLGIKADAGACFTPDGKKIMLADADDDKESITYTIVDANGKNKKEIYKFKLGQLKQYRPNDVYNVFNSRQGVFSADGKMFLTCPDMDKPENMKFLYMGIPVITCGLDGKTKLVRRIDSSTQRGAPNYTYGMLIINGAFGKDDNVFYALVDRAVQDGTGLTGSSKIMKFDAQANQTKTIANTDIVMGPTIFISPDRSRLAGIAYHIERSDRMYIQTMKLWAYDIPSEQFSVSLPLGENMYNILPNIIWSQDNSTIYALLAAQNVVTGVKIFKPFTVPQKPTEEEVKAFKALAVQLGDENYKTRDSATEKLLSAGSKAADIIQESLKSDDPEVASRAKKLLSEMTGKVTTILNQKNIETMIEVAPGYLCVKYANSNSTSLVDVATGKSKSIAGMDKLALIDKSGDVGLFRDTKDQSLWTATILFSSDKSSSATQPDDDEGS